MGPNLFLIVLHKNIEYVEVGTSDGKHVTEKDSRWVIRGDDQHVMNDFEVAPSTCVFLHRECCLFYESLNRDATHLVASGLMRLHHRTCHSNPFPFSV